MSEGRRTRFSAPRKPVRLRTVRATASENELVRALAPERKDRAMALTADGARRLREVRDYIVAHPDRFDMGQWYGTACCIAGHLAIQAGIADCDYVWCGTGPVSDLLGFGPDFILRGSGHPLEPLFYNAMADTDPVYHAKQIDAFLWQYGYPPNAIESDPAQTLGAPQADVAVARTAGSSTSLQRA